MSNQTTRTTARILPEGAPPPRYGNFAIHFSAAADNWITLDVRANTHFISLCLAFESVELLECELEVSAPPNDAPTGLLSFGFVPSSATADTRFNHAHTRQLYTSINSATNVRIALPADHNFGRELKASVLGNSIPIAFVVSKKVGAVACMRFRACFHGSALG